MTRLPFILDRVRDALSIDPPQANPHHLTILETAQYCWELDEHLDTLVGDHADAVGAIEQPELFTRLLHDRLRAEAALDQLLSAPCCGIDTDPDEDNETRTTADDLLCCPGQPTTIVHACLNSFADAGDPPGMSSQDLIDQLRRRAPGPGGQGPYDGLIQTRLAQLLAFHHVYPCTMPETAGGKGYRRSALLAALPPCSC